MKLRFQKILDHVKILWCQTLYNGHDQIGWSVQSTQVEAQSIQMDRQEEEQPYTSDDGLGFQGKPIASLHTTDVYTHICIPLQRVIH